MTGHDHHHHHHHGHEWHPFGNATHASWKYCEHHDFATEDCKEMRKMKCIVTGGIYLLIFIVLVFGVCWAIRERKKRRCDAVVNGGYPARSGSYTTGLFECFGFPRICVPATFFSPFLAAFNRASSDKRECHACDALFSLKTPITQYHTRQSIRAEHQLEEATCMDCLSAVFCTPCAVAQDSLELERRAAQPAMSVVVVSSDGEKSESVDYMEKSEPLVGIANKEYEQVPAQCQV